MLLICPYNNICGSKHCIHHNIHEYYDFERSYCKEHMKRCTMAGKTINRKEVCQPIDEQQYKLIRKEQLEILKYYCY